MLNYKDLNSSAKETIVLIHGLGASLDMWELQFDALTNAGYRVIAPDMAGFGDSAEQTTPLTIESMASSVNKLLEALDIEKAHIIGLSMGGAIAQRFALDYPEKLGKLVLSNTAARFANKLIGLKYLAMRYIMLKIVSRETSAKSIAKFVFPKKNQQEFRNKFIAQILKATDQAYLDATKAVIRHDLRKEVGNIKALSLVILGKKDKITPPFILKRLAKLIPNAKLIELEGGHVTPVDSAEEFNKAVIDFLKQTH